MDSDLNQCFWCETKDGLEICPDCKLVGYCNDSHKSFHKTDDDYCMPFRIKSTPQAGRFTIATRDIKPLELIISEHPVIIGPSRQQCIVCLECLESVEDLRYFCRDCGFPMCNEDCAKEGDWHARFECPYFLKNGYKCNKSIEGIKFETPVDPLLIQIAAVTPLRLLLTLRGLVNSENSIRMKERKMHVEPNNDYASLKSIKFESDMAKVIKIMYYGNLDLNNNCNKSYKNDDDDDDDDLEFQIEASMKMIFNNAKSLETSGNNGSGLYCLYSLMNHSCLNNTKNSISKLKKREKREKKNWGGGGLMEVRAKQFGIRKGEEISTRYIGPNMGQPGRFDMLASHWNFNCECKRCLDPTELNSFNSAVKCQSCQDDNFMLPTYRDKTLIWKCTKCPAKTSKEKMIEIVEDGLEIIRYHIGNGPSNGKRKIDLNKFYQTVTELERTFHSNHYIILQVKFVLMNILSNWNENSPKIWKDLIKVSSEMLAVFDKLDPGYSKNRGKILKELIPAMMKFATYKLENEEVTQDEFNTTKKIAHKFAQDLISCYKFDPL